jgi:hypothetical protein
VIVPQFYSSFGLSSIIIPKTSLLGYPLRQYC